jgi:hypothetical protein
LGDQKISTWYHLLRRSNPPKDEDGIKDDDDAPPKDKDDIKRLTVLALLCNKL